MAEDGGTVGKLWKRHGGGYYALWAVGTFIYLEIFNVVDSVTSAEGVGDFVMSEAASFIVEMLLNSLFASLWPLYWYNRMGWSIAGWALGGYLVWAFLLAWALTKRQAELKKELGLD